MAFRCSLLSVLLEPEVQKYLSQSKKKKKKVLVLVEDLEPNLIHSLLIWRIR